MVLACFARVSLALVSFTNVVMLFPIVLRTKGKIAGRVMPQRVLYLLHVFYLIGAWIAARSHWLVILDAEVYTRDRVFAGEHTDLVRGLILETRGRRVENNHLVVLLDHPLYVILELLLVL